MNQAGALYIFNYTALDFTNKEVKSFFVAETLDEAKTVLNGLGYKNIEITPLKPGDKRPNINKEIDLTNIASELEDLKNGLTASKNNFTAVALTSRKSSENRNVYERLAYFVYKSTRLSVAMKKMGPVFPKDIIDTIELGENKNNIIGSLDELITKYKKKQKRKKGGLLSFLTKPIELPGSKPSTAPTQATPDLINDEQLLKTAPASATKTSTTNKIFPFKYTALDETGKKVTSYFDAESINDCIHFLELQGYTNIHVEPRKAYDIEIILDKKLPSAVLAFDLTQLSTYLKAGIPLVEGVSILSKQSTSAAAKKAYQRLVYDLLKGDSLSKAMTNQDPTFPKLLVNMIKSAEVTGDLPTILDDMAEYYEDTEQTKKAMKSAMIYPVLVLILAVGVLVFMLLFLVPQFVSLYESNGAELPAITKFVIGMSDFFRKDWMYLLIGIIGSITVFLIAFKKIQPFRRLVQTLLMRIPSLGNIIIYNEVYNFTKTFASLLNHGVFITDSMEILSNITDNEIYKELIANTLKNLSMGNNISTAFKGKWAFPMVAYHMLVTGENTGQLGLMMEKVSNHYKQLHKNMVDQLKSLIEPVMILLVAGIVGLILLSIITPMFDIYNQIQ